jgi:hypothetical protein
MASLSVQEWQLVIRLATVSGETDMAGNGDPATFWLYPALPVYEHGCTKASACFFDEPDDPEDSVTTSMDW